MKMRCAGAVLAGAVVALAAGRAGASVTNQEYYPMDGSAGTFGPGNRPLDQSGNGRDFGIGINGSTGVTITSDAPPGRSGSYVFDGTAYFYSVNYTAPTDNVGIEAWVKPYSLGDQQIFESADGGGMTLQLYNQGLGASYDFVTYVGGTVSPTPGAWYDVAVVRNNGVGTFYVNGVAVGSSTTATPNSGSSALLGTSKGNAAPYTGQIDAVRLFTFAPGAFNPSTDLYSGTGSVPEPTSLALIGLAGAGLLARRRRTR